MPHLQPGSAPPAGSPGADPAAPGSPISSDDPLTAPRDDDPLTAPRDEDTLHLGVPQKWSQPPAQRAGSSRASPTPHPTRASRTDAEEAAGQAHTPPLGVPALLGVPADWPAVPTEAGLFQLMPVRLPRDLSLVSAWMNDPAVAAFWELSGPERVTEAHLRPQLEGDGRSVPCVGALDGTPMSYWELYRADLDPLARHCRIQPYDTGVHLLIGSAAHRGRGLGTLLLRTVADLVLDQLPRCTRVLAEPDVRNVPSVAAFLGAGFRLGAEIKLPGKRAALMVRDRELRHQL
ncbi:GNAT family N-acetyltransferase [Streptomyces spirodelae]|uniref:Lysine N-acyltransferase MbtK n=1 Tax=Streptomyces spirodelae TaxID=2812904 RepID=A0ABS3X144_9ACTN|nr:GNAT family N-acetyltransferase [Streptomyces spirodelae]MBO8189048.1 GNAT family N-acetyltransferase [Streptomyces spirodelae]